MAIRTHMEPWESVGHLVDLTEQFNTWMDTFPAPLQERANSLRRAAWSRGLRLTSVVDGSVLDHTARRPKRVHAELMMPVDVEGWMADLGTDDPAAEFFWQQIDQVEHEGARLAFWFDLRLHPDLTGGLGLELLREVLLRELVSRGCPVDLVVHEGGAEGPVAHVLFVMREAERMRSRLYPAAVAARTTPGP